MNTFLALSAALILAGNAHAATKTYQFSGTVSSIVEGSGYFQTPTVLSSTPVVGGAIALGDTFKGTFSFDTATSPFTGYSSPYGSQSTYGGGALSAAFSGSGPSIASSSSTYTYVFDQPAGSNSPDEVTVYGYTYDYTGTPTQRTLILSLKDSDAALLASTAFPDTQLDGFAAKTFTLQELRAVNGVFSTLSVSGQLASFNAVSPVPEPSMSVCILASLGLLAWRCKRGSRR